MKDVHIYEVGPRDGLQNEKAIIPAATKIALVDLLSAAGFETIEVTSFVSPKWVPQMADAAEVMAGITRRPGTHYAALTPNERGLERALEAGADEVAIFGSASETFSLKNINCTIAESLERFAPVARKALDAGVALRGYVSCVAGCPYEGKIAPAAVRDIAARLDDLGCAQISLGDTIGTGTPNQIASMLEEVLKSVPANRLAGHYHDTHHRALDNVAVSLDHGLRIFDAAIGGLGGCPYAPGAKGNVSTTALAAMLEEKGWQTGLAREKLQEAETFVKREIKAEREQ